MCEVAVFGSSRLRHLQNEMNGQEWMLILSPDARKLITHTPRVNNKLPVLCGPPLMLIDCSQGHRTHDKFLVPVTHQV